MSLLVPSPENFSLAGRQTRATEIPRIRIRSVRLTVFSGVKDSEKEVLRLRGDDYEDGVRWLNGQVKESETTPFRSRKGKEEEEKKRDYYVNTGSAIRTLREDIPEVFYRELSFYIYRDDIVFKDPLNAFAGIENYKSIFFRALWVDIISVWQPMENMILIRWTVHGIPRIPWESCSRFDGDSEYKLDKDGKIYEHKVHNIALNGPQGFQIHAVEQLFQSIGCSSTPNPTYSEFSFSSMEILFQYQNKLSSALNLLEYEVEQKQNL